MAKYYAGVFVSTLICFLVTTYFLRDVLKADWKRLRIKLWKLLCIGVLGTVFLQIILVLEMIAASQNISINLDEMDEWQLILLGVYPLYGLMTAITEELYFRYLFFSFVKRKVGKVIILFVSSGLFGLVHYW